MRTAALARWLPPPPPLPSEASVSARHLRGEPLPARLANTKPRNPPALTRKHRRHAHADAQPGDLAVHPHAPAMSTVHRHGVTPGARCGAVGLAVRLQRSHATDGAVPLGLSVTLGVTRLAIGATAPAAPAAVHGAPRPVEVLLPEALMVREKRQRGGGSGQRSRRR